MPLRNKRRDDSGGGGKLDLGALFGAIMPDQGVDVATDEATGKVSAKAKSPGRDRLFNQGRSGQQATDINAREALDTSRSRRDAITAKEQTTQSGIESRKTQEEGALLQRGTHAANKKVDFDYDEQIAKAHKLRIEEHAIFDNAMTTFGVPPEKVPTNMKDEALNIAFKTLQAKGAKADEDISRSGRAKVKEDALLPGEAESAVAGQRNQFSKDELDTTKNFQSQEILAKDPSIMKSIMEQQRFMGVGQGQVLYDPVTKRRIEGSTTIEKPTVKSSVNLPTGGKLETAGEPIKERVPFRDLVAPETMEQMIQSIEQKKRLRLQLGQ